MKSYFGYIRVSTPKQGRGVSLDEQREAIVRHAQRIGLSLTDWYVETETAAKQGRTEYTKLIRALEAGKAQGVIIHKIDRGARNLKDWANLGDLIDSGVDVQFAHESLDMRSRGGRLAADIQAVVAADYIRNLRDEVMKGFYGRLKQGVYPLPAPIGYLDRGAGIPKDVDPINAPLVRYAFERYSVGDIGVIALQKELAERGFKTHRGAAPTFNTLTRMLHNPFYIGLIRIQKRGEIFQGAHTPLISKDLFDRVQDVMAGKHHPKTKKHSFRYRGLVQHIGCTRRLTGEIAKGRFIYYRCHGPRCKGVIVSEPIMEKAVAAKLQSVTCTPDDMRELRDLVTDRRSKRTADTERDETSLKLRIVRCDGPDTPMGDAQYIYADRPDPFFLGPKATEIGEMLLVPGLNELIQNGAPGLNGPVPFLFIYGRAEYDDIFGAHHIFQWCYRMRPESHRGERPTVQFIQWGDYNQAYEGKPSDRWPPAPRPWWEATATG